MDQQAWLQNAIQYDQATQKALELYCLGMDKELATMAGYKALGLDPRDVPRFGWMMPRPPQVSTVHNVNISDQQRPEPAPAAPAVVRAGRGLLGPVLGTAGAVAGLAALYGAYRHDPNPPPPSVPAVTAPAPAAVAPPPDPDNRKPRQWEVRIQTLDGKWHSQIIEDK